MKTTLYKLGIVLCLLIVGCSNENAHDKPNVILIFPDDLGYGQVSAYPQTKSWQTPNIDNLAQQGVRMTQGYSAHPMCWPSRASMLTGRYYERFLQGFIVPKSEKMISQYFQEQGYRTGLVGKWHNVANRTGTYREDPENHPLKWGFDEFDGFLTGAHDYFADTLGWHTSEVYAPIYEDYDEVQKEVPYLTTYFTDKATDFIEQHHEEPFFLIVTYSAVHTPEQAPEELVEKNNGDTEAAMLEALDNGVGRIMASLDKHNLSENTLVALVGDNGGYMNQSNWKLRSGKARLYEGGIRVPFILKWPGEIKAGSVYEKPVMHIDILPTLLGAAQIEPDQSIPLDGKNLLPFLSGEQKGNPHEALFWEKRNYNRFAVRKGKWKLVRGNEDLRAEPEMGLYNLEKDIGERDNLIDQHPKIKSELMQLFEQWKQEVQADRQAK